MSQIELPSDVEAVLERFFTCEFATLNKAGEPVTWPTLPYYNQADGTIIIAASIAFPVKTYNARRHPKVSLLFSDPTGSKLADPPAVLVQGDAVVQEVLDYAPWQIEMFKTSIRRQPDSRKYVSNPIAQRLFEFYYQRIAVMIHPRRIRAWAGMDFGREPTEWTAGDAPPAVESKPITPSSPSSAAPVWNQALAACARNQSSATLTVMEPSGYPVIVRCKVTLDDAKQVISFSELPSLASGWRGKACLLFHSHNDVLEDFRELMIRGDLVEEDGALVMRPTVFVTGSGSDKTDLMPHAGTPIDLIKFMMLGRRKAREYLAKRGTQWPPTMFSNLVKAVKEVEAEEKSQAAK
jgi:Pyridoxamine 5'-phosphate oxidase